MSTRAWLMLLAALPWLAPLAVAQAGRDGFEVQVREEAAHWTPAEFRAASDAYGKLVEIARERRDAPPALAELRATGDRFHTACRERFRALEAASGEDEARLEALYRSEQWHDINYALAAIRYWQAWVDLAIANAAHSDELRIPALLRAERGFQATAVRILFPGLVYGSWLGMAYAELARGEDGAAEQRLQRLGAALAADTGNPLAEVVEAELAVLRARRGEVQAQLPAADAVLTPVLARRLEEEAFALLEQRRHEEVIATGAGERLQRLVDGGYLDDRLVARMLAYRDELVGREMGQTGLLLDAEYAFANRQYETTILKYREFERLGGFQGSFDPSPFRYHLAAALYELQYFREALEQAAELVAHPVLGADARKLRFLAARALQGEHAGEPAQRELEVAAREFLARAPADPDAALAHLALAGTGGAEADVHLAAARADPRMREAADRAELERALGEFASAARHNDLPARAAAAGKVLAALEKLPRKTRQQPALRALALQMRVAAGERGEELLAELAALRAELLADGEHVAVLAWAELRAREGEHLLAAAERLARANADAARRELVAFLLELERAGASVALEPLLARVLPVLTAQPDTARQLMLMRLRALAALGRAEESRAAAEELVARFADSGDAWLAYTEVMARAGDAFAARRGWARIASGTPVGSDHWIEATLSGIALDEGGSAAGHCAALARADDYRARMSVAQRERAAELVRVNGCESAGGNDA